MLQYVSHLMCLLSNVWQSTVVIGDLFTGSRGLLWTNNVKENHEPDIKKTAWLLKDMQGQITLLCGLLSTSDDFHIHVIQFEILIIRYL